MAIITRVEHDGAGGVGTGRYVLAALLFFPIGLAVQYWARDYGWLGTWINVVLMLGSVVVLAMAGGFDTQECYRTASGQLVCP